MFCPKCGTENPETGKFCRSCGIELGNVSAVVSGNLQPVQSSFYIDHRGRKRSNNPLDIWSSSVRNIVSGIGFLIISAALFFTGVAGGRAWWWAMLFPAFSMLASGISQMVKVRRMEKTTQEKHIKSDELPQHQVNQALPPTNTEFIKPQGSIYETGELVERPPSVTEGTTRHLEINKEGETMTLPKIEETK